MRWMAGAVLFLAEATAFAGLGGGLPDLTVEAFDLTIVRDATVDPGDVVEGCTEAASGRTLLRFALRTRNVGDADLVLGDPGCPDCAANPGAACTNSRFVCAPAHDHAHFGGYVRAELVRADDGVIAVGRKVGFCVLDLECAAPQYTCSFQGLSAGCADVYPAALPCQYVDVTGLPLDPGGYHLRVTVDPDGLVAEADESNNTTEVPLPLDCDNGRDVLTACAPNPFVCYDTRLEGRGEPRLTPPATRAVVGTFGPLDVAVVRPTRVCAPAATADAPLADGATHLRTYAVRPARNRDLVARGVRLVTGLGEVALDVRPAAVYAVPAAADTGAPVPLVPAEHTVDRFACFDVRVPRGLRRTLRATPVPVDDAVLGTGRTLVLKKPRRFCTPVAASETPMRIATRHLLCFEVAKAPSAGGAVRSVADELTARVVTLGRAREVCLLAEKNPPRPAPEDLQPCAGRVDVWSFEAGAGRTVGIHVDTATADTASDLCAELTCGALALAGNDEVACTTGPFRCPEAGGVTITTGTCIATVHTCAGGCASPTRADYVLRASVAGEDAAPVLVADDAVASP